MNITLESKNVERALNIAINAAKNPAVILDEVGAEALRQVNENFIAGGSIKGRWQPLSDETLFRVAGKSGRKKNGDLSKRGFKKVANKKMHGVLRDTTNLQRKIHYKVEGTTVMVGVDNVKYGAIHHFGGKAGRGKKVTIPARPWLVLRDKSMIIRAARIALEYQLRS